MNRYFAFAATAAVALGAAFAAVTISGPGGDTTVIRVADNWAPTHPMAAAVDSVFKQQIEERSNGELKVEVYHSGTLGNESDLWDGVRNGTIDVAVVGTPMNEEFPTMRISDWPFLYRDLDHAEAVWTGDIADEVSQKFHEKFPTTYILGWGPNSARTFSSSKPLESVDDFAGQKFRMPGNPIHIGIVEALGASPQVIPLGDLFTALETGVVDGQDNGMVTVISEAFYEVQDYVLETNHIIATLELVSNAYFLDNLSPEHQEIVRAAGQATAIKAWEDYKDSIDADREFLQSHGVTVTPLSEEDRTELISKTTPLVNKLLADNDWAPELTAKIADVK